MSSWVEMRHVLMGAFAPVLLSTGCSTPLQSAVGVANAVGVVASSASLRVETAFKRADAACVWSAPQVPLPTTADEKQKCVDEVRAKYLAALKAYDVMFLAWDALTDAVDDATLASALGNNVDAAELAKLSTASWKAFNDFKTARAALAGKGAR